MVFLSLQFKRLTNSVEQTIDNRIRTAILVGSTAAVIPILKLRLGILFHSGTGSRSCAVR